MELEVSRPTYLGILNVSQYHVDVDIDIRMQMQKSPLTQDQPGLVSLVKTGVNEKKVCKALEKVAGEVGVKYITSGALLINSIPFIFPISSCRRTLFWIELIVWHVVVK